MAEAESRFSIRLQGERLLDRYVVGAQIGAGGMATVYLGTDTQLEMRVVVKVPHGALLAERGFRDRFQKEIQDLVALQHPHIVTILARGEHDDVPFLVQQYIDGGSLDDVLRSAPDRRIPLADVRAWIRDVARALDFMHARGVVHRDVKPANVLLDRHRNVYLSDFGIAKAMGGTDTGLTLTGAAPGSPTYMAPEQARGAALAGTADQYALASTVYEALAGRPPYQGDNLLDVLVRKQSEEPPALSSLVPGLPVAAGAAVERGLARDPEHRFASCEAFVDALLDPGAPKAERVDPEDQDAEPTPASIGKADEEAPFRPAVVAVPKDLGAGPPVSDQAPLTTETTNRATKPRARQTFVVNDPNKAKPKRSFLFSFQVSTLVLLVAVGIGVLLMNQDDGADPAPQGERSVAKKMGDAPLRPSTERPRPVGHVAQPTTGDRSQFVGSWVPDWAAMRRLVAAGGIEAESLDEELIADSRSVRFSLVISDGADWTLSYQESKELNLPRYEVGGTWSMKTSGVATLRIQRGNDAHVTRVSSLELRITGPRLVIPFAGSRILLRRRP